MKNIAILTFQNALNYGALLQAYALQQKLLSIGMQADILNYDNKVFHLQYIVNESFRLCPNIKRKIKLGAKWIFKPQKMFRNKRKKDGLCDFIKHKLVLSEYCDRNTIADVCRQYKKIIVGSDQVWNLRWSHGDTTYLLDFIQDNAKKYTYAASFGKESFSKNELEVYAKYLPQFKSLLIREKTGKLFLKDKLGLESSVVLDPTLLLEKSNWIDFSKGIRLDSRIKRKYILIYLIGPQIQMVDLAQKYALDNELDIVTLSGLNDNMSSINVEDSLLEEFVNYIVHAECIFTTSFHGLAFAINLNKAFYYELSQESGNNSCRLSDLATELGVSNREVKNCVLSDFPIKWEEVNKKLKFLRQLSIDHLQKLVEME